MHKSVPVKSVVPNPFRHMERYPVQKDKIEALTASMGRTGFWENVVARLCGDTYQLAYGHHRWIAYREKYGDKGNITLIVRDLSDADMLKIMADENMAEFGTSAAVEQETVRAVVLAYAEGRIELERPEKNGHVRYAPFFRKGKFKDVKLTHPYTAESIARFLGWMSGEQVSPRVRNALSALEAIEDELVEEEDIAGLSSDQADELAKQAKRIVSSFDGVAAQAATPQRKEELKQAGRAKAKTAAKVVAEKVKKADKKNPFGVRDIKSKMEVERYRSPERKAPPSVEKFCSALAKELNYLLSAKDKRWADIDELIKYRDVVPEEDMNNVVSALKSLAERCARIAVNLMETPKRIGGVSVFNNGRNQ